jgi:hypothetical protein
VIFLGCGNEEGSAPPPDPWLLMEPADSTSLVDGATIRVVVTAASGPPVFEHALLATIANSLTLVQLSTGAPIGFVATVHETGATSNGGLNDDVQVTPAAPLAPESWYELRLSPTPERVRLNPKGMRDLGGGGVASRFTTGSHPTLQSLSGCLKEGIFKVDLRLSEPVNLTADIASLLRLEPLDPSGVCSLRMPSLPVTSVGGFGFDCQLADYRIGTFVLSAAQSITSPTGASFEAAPGVPGDYSLLIEASMWASYDIVCGRVVPP